MLSHGDILPLHLADLTFPDWHPLHGQPGPVFAFAIRHPGGVLLFDTGVGGGNAALDDLYQVRRHALAARLAFHGLRPADVGAVINSHLHFDHCGGNPLFPGIPIYVQADEYRVAHQAGYTIAEWVDFPGARYVEIQGDLAIATSVSVLRTPGHTPGHQSLLVTTGAGPVVLAGQAVYSGAEYEHIRAGGGIPAGDPPPDPAAYLASAQRLVAMQPRRVHFSHDAEAWEARR